MNGNKCNQCEFYDKKKDKCNVKEIGKCSEVDTSKCSDFLVKENLVHF